MLALKQNVYPIWSLAQTIFIQNIDKAFHLLSHYKCSSFTTVSSQKRKTHSQEQKSSTFPTKANNWTKMENFEKDKNEELWERKMVLSLICRKRGIVQNSKEVKWKAKFHNLKLISYLIIIMNVTVDQYTNESWSISPK